MKGKYIYSPIHLFYDELSKGFFKEYLGDNDYDEIDDILKLILLNNGCKINESYEPKQMIREISTEDEYEIRFITGMIGNDANEFYDFLVFNGKKVLVIFEDYFNFVTDKDISNDSEVNITALMGNSIYYDALKKIVEVFYLTSEPIPGSLLTTAMVSTQRWNQAIIAIHIINHFKPVDDNDVVDMPIEDARNILNGNVKLQLYGIRNV